LPSFLAHHRSLGVDLFVFLDLSEERELSAHLAEEADCAVWLPRNTTGSKWALQWLNFLRTRYATGHWCLSVEPCDFVVFYRSETRTIKDLIEFAQTEGSRQLYAVAIEMYGERPAAEIRLGEGQNPLELLSYFDPHGYVTATPGRYGNVVIRGGPQRRALHAARSSALNRMPLVKWKWFFTYAAGTRLLMPRRVNRPHRSAHTSPTICLLCFAQLYDDATLRRAAELEAGKTVRDGGGSSYRGAARLRQLALKTEDSVRFKSSADLAECGLINPGQWF
jgi:hypothetical protein